jgi:alpha-mannosidase
MFESFHEGPLPASGSYVDGGHGSVVFTVLKAEEDGDGWVLRGFESAGREANASVELFGRTIELAFGANEIKTVVVPRDPAQPVRETNLLEL